jgi:hypothetical protein
LSTAASVRNVTVFSFGKPSLLRCERRAGGWFVCRVWRRLGARAEMGRRLLAVAASASWGLLCLPGLLSPLPGSDSYTPPRGWPHRHPNRPANPASSTRSATNSEPKTPLRKRNRRPQGRSEEAATGTGRRTWKDPPPRQHQQLTCRPTSVTPLQTSDGFKCQVLGCSPGVGERIQVQAEPFDTGYFSPRDVMTKWFAEWRSTACMSVCSTVGSLARPPAAARQVDGSHPGPTRCLVPGLTRPIIFCLG